MLARALHNRVHRPQIDVPAPPRHIVGVADFVCKLRDLAADLADSRPFRGLQIFSTRKSCPEARNSHHRQPGEPAKAAPSLLPMYKEPAKPKEVKPVGRYALNISWNDGHSSGIYSWDYLREMCRCEECTRSGDRVIR